MVGFHLFPSRALKNVPRVIISHEKKKRKVMRAIHHLNLSMNYFDLEKENQNTCVL